MIRILFSAIVIVAATYQPAHAVGALVAATKNMHLAAEICLRNYRSEADLADAFRAAGFTVTAGQDTGFFDFEAPQVWGGFSTDPADGYCYVQSGDVSLSIAEEMGLRLAQSLFGDDKVVPGNPELAAGQPVPPCDGLSVYATQQLIRITYSAAGNSGECLNDGTSAIVINI